MDSFMPKTQKKHYKKSLFHKIIGNKKFLKHAIFPSSAIVLFMATVIYWNNQNYGLALEYKGQTIAKVASEEVYEKANHMIAEQLTPSIKTKAEEVRTEVKIAPVSKSECCESPAVIKDKIIEKSQEVISEGCGIYINDKLVGVSKSKTEANEILEEILEQERTKIEGFDAEFEEKIDLITGIFAPEEVKDKSSLKNILTVGSKKAISYTVESEDTITGIAEKFNITPERLLEINNIENNAIHVEDELTIKTLEKNLHVRLFKIESEEREIPYSTEKEEDSSKETDYEEELQAGQNGSEKITYKIVYVDGQNDIKEETNSEIITEPTARRVKVGTKQKEQVKTCGTGLLTWPVAYTNHVTSEYGMRNGRFHKGIDIASAGVGGKSITAADGGTVQYAGCGGGYGNYLKISHGNGIVTLYAHCRSLSVKKGDKVFKGQKIASVGSTGDSTGSHLHFEVIVNGASQNPKKYV